LVDIEADAEIENGDPSQQETTGGDEDSEHAVHSAGTINSLIP
jgi:hypothetical protein